MENYDIYRVDGYTLRIFLSVCQTGSLSRTAALLDLNQSTISYTLDKMRAAIGDDLFVKSGRGVIPSERALSLVPQVQQILSEIEGLAHKEKYDPSADPTAVKIAISTPALLQDVKRIHAGILASSPRKRLELIRLAPRDRIVEILEHGEADVAISVAGFQYPTTLNHQTYSTDKLVVFYDPQHRDKLASIEDYTNAKHAVVDFGGTTKSVVETALGERGLSRTVSLVAPTTSMLGDLILGTDIIATMQLKLADSIFKGLRHCPAPIDLPEVVYDLVWHRRNEHSGRNHWIRDLIQSHQGPASEPSPTADKLRHQT